MLGLSVSRVGWKIGDDYASKGEAKKVFGNRICSYFSDGIKSASVGRFVDSRFEFIVNKEEILF